MLHSIVCSDAFYTQVTLSHFLGDTFHVLSLFIKFLTLSSHSKRRTKLHFYTGALGNSLHREKKKRKTKKKTSLHRPKDENLC